MIYNLAQILTKVSFLLIYRRIFRDELTRQVSLALMMFLIAWGIAQEFLVGLACTPVPMFIPSMQGHCVDSLTVWYLTSIMNIVTDFIIFLTPMPAIKHLQLRRKQKILVGGIFGLGFFTCIISIVRLFTLRAAIETKDPTWDNVPVSYWTVVELNSGIMCASAATLRPLLRRVIPGLSHKDEAYNGNKTSLPSNQSQHTQHGAPDMYALPDLEASGSQERLKQNMPGIYDASQDRAATLTTNIYGGPWAEQQAARDDGIGGRSDSRREIRVTRQTSRLEEKRKSRNGPAE